MSNSIAQDIMLFTIGFLAGCWLMSGVRRREWPKTLVTFRGGPFDGHQKVVEAGVDVFTFERRDEDLEYVGPRHYYVRTCDTVMTYRNTTEIEN